MPKENAGTRRGWTLCVRITLICLAIGVFMVFAENLLLTDDAAERWGGLFHGHGGQQQQEAPGAALAAAAPAEGNAAPGGGDMLRAVKGMVLDAAAVAGAAVAGGVGGGSSLIHGHATEEGTALYRQRFGFDLPERHFSIVTDDKLTVSSLGIGTYLGDANTKTDQAVEAAIVRSVVEGGINVIDSAINYRGMRGERSTGRAMRTLLGQKGVKREELFVSTKAGFIPGDTEAHSSPKHTLAAWKQAQTIPDAAVVDGKSCIHPACLRSSLETSRKNLQLETIDLFYLHNAAEKQLVQLGRPAFLERLRDAFIFLEDMRKSGYIRFYGMATWTCFRTRPGSQQYLSLEQVVNIAADVGGADHGFRFVQAPVNVAMPEAWAEQWQTVNEHPASLLEAAHGLGVHVMSSKSVAGARQSAAQSSIRDFSACAELARQGGQVSANIPTMLHLTRSFPGLSTAIVGMKAPLHVEQNLKVARVEPLTRKQMTDCMAAAHPRALRGAKPKNQGHGHGHGPGHGHGHGHGRSHA